MKTNETSCKKCNGIGKPSKALLNILVSSNDFGNDAGQRGTTISRRGKAKLVDCLKCESCGHSWIPDKTSRELALAWWNTINGTFKQRDLGLKYYPNRNGLTGREIEEIWRKEVQVKELSNAYHNEEYLEKSNQKQYSQEEVDRLLDQQAARTTAQILENKKKQFKQFDESLFKAYIDKFSTRDLSIAFDVFITRLLEDGFIKDNLIEAIKNK